MEAAGVIKQKVLWEGRDGAMVRRRISKSAGGRRYEKSVAYIIPSTYKKRKIKINADYGKFSAMRRLRRFRRDVFKEYIRRAGGDVDKAVDMLFDDIEKT